MNFGGLRDAADVNALFSWGRGGIQRSVEMETTRRTERSFLAKDQDAGRKGFVGGKRRLHKTLGRILMNDEFNKCLTPVKYEAVRGVGEVVGLEGVDGMSVDLVGICECPFQTRVVPDLC